MLKISQRNFRENIGIVFWPWIVLIETDSGQPHTRQLVQKLDVESCRKSEEVTAYIS